MIHPLGEQIIIRTFLPGQIGSILIPESAKGITMMGAGTQQKKTDYLISSELLDGMIDILRGQKRRDLKDLLKNAENAKSAPIAQNFSNAVHFVEAEVIAVGPGKRSKGDATLVDDLVEALNWCSPFDGYEAIMAKQRLRQRANNRSERVPLTVKPGDRILYHPAVQKFDRQIEPELIGLKSGDGECFIIREESVLAILDSEEQTERSANQTDSAVA